MTFRSSPKSTLEKRNSHLCASLIQDQTGCGYNQNIASIAQLKERALMRMRVIPSRCRSKTSPLFLDMVQEMSLAGKFRIKFA